MKLANAAQAEMDKANKELEEAKPAMQAAADAVSCLDKKAFQELKAFATPPPALLDVAKACLLLRGEKKNFAWPNFLKAIGNPQKFLDDLTNFDGRSIDQWILDQLKPVLALEHFSYEVMKGKSIAASFLCKWIINIVIFNTIYKKVKPLMEMAEAA
jgi:dynein heavy chain